MMDTLFHPNHYTPNSFQNLNKLSRNCNRNGTVHDQKCIESSAVITKSVGSGWDCIYVYRHIHKYIIYLRVCIYLYRCMYIPIGVSQTQTHRHADTQTDRQTDRQTHTHTHTNVYHRVRYCRRDSWIIMWYGFNSTAYTSHMARKDTSKWPAYVCVYVFLCVFVCICTNVRCMVPPTQTHTCQCK
jgi:hypothetical protein